MREGMEEAEKLRTIEGRLEWNEGGNYLNQQCRCPCKTQNYFKCPCKYTMTKYAGK